jgi:N,N-dimethylformamidase
MPTIDPKRLDLAAEYRAKPFGRHSPELQALLNMMRRAEYCQDLILVSVSPGKWVLGQRLPDGKPPRLFIDKVFDCLEDGEWEAFKRRWRVLAGEELRLP